MALFRQFPVLIIMVLATAAAGLVVSAGAQQPSTPPACKRPELEWNHWRQDVLDHHANIIAFELLSPESDRLAKAYGCDKSADTCPPDKVVVFHCAGNRKVLFAFVKDGCVTFAKDIPADEFRRFVTGGDPC